MLATVKRLVDICEWVSTIGLFALIGWECRDNVAIMLMAFILALVCGCVLIKRIYKVRQLDKVYNTKSHDIIDYPSTCPLIAISILAGVCVYYCEFGPLNVIACVAMSIAIFELLRWALAQL